MVVLVLVYLSTYHYRPSEQTNNHASYKPANHIKEFLLKYGCERFKGKSGGTVLVPHPFMINSATYSSIYAPIQRLNLCAYVIEILFEIVLLDALLPQVTLLSLNQVNILLHTRLFP